VTLISKAAPQGHIEQRQSAITQLLLGNLDAMREKPAVRRYSHAASNALTNPPVFQGLSHRRAMPTSR
jgi:hypothetical protein